MDNIPSLQTAKGLQKAKGDVRENLFVYHKMQTFATFLLGLALCVVEGNSRSKISPHTGVPSSSVGRIQPPLLSHHPRVQVSEFLPSSVTASGF